MVLLPAPGSALTPRFAGPYVVDSRMSLTDYVILTPDCRRKKHLYHNNMLKLFYSREAAVGEQVITPGTAVPDARASLVCVTPACDDNLWLPSASNSVGDF